MCVLRACGSAMMVSTVYLSWVMMLVLCSVGSRASADNDRNQTDTSYKWLMDVYNPYKFSNFSEMFIDKSCEKDMNEYVEALRREDLWAVQMSDSSGRYSSQFFFGNDYWLGSQTLCAEVSKSKTAPFPLSFHIARLKVKLSLKLTPRERILLLGVCFPSSCTSDDIMKILSHKYNATAVNEKGLLTVVRVRQVPGKYDLLEDKKFLALAGSVLVIAFLMIIGTFSEMVINYKKNQSLKKFEKELKEKCEEHRRDIENNNEKKNSFEIKSRMNIYKVAEKEIFQNKKKENDKENDGNAGEVGQGSESPKNFACEFLLSFSILSNASKILSCSNSSEDSLTSVHGLRFFSLAWVVMVHTYLQIFSIGVNKGLRAVTERNFVYQLIGNATYSVDTFFIISGLLVSYLYFKNSKDDLRAPSFPTLFGKFATLIIYRFIRLTPVYIVVLGMVHLTMTFLKDISVFETPLIVELNCDNFWWRNILYINNFFPRKEMCMLWSWYMAADTQFFVLSAIFLLVAKKYFKFSVISLFFLLISSWCTTAYIAYTHQFQVKVQDPFALFDELYDKPWTRIGPYIVGMCVGWFLCEKNGKLSISMPIVLAGWAVSLGGLLGLIFCIGDGFGVGESSVYAALGHTAWGLCLAWIVVACRYGYGGWINSLLSCHAFFPFSRLTYCAYLVHPVIMFLTNYLMDGPFHMHNGVVVIIFLGNLMASYLLSLVLSLAFEAPFVRILKLVLSLQKKR